MPLAARHSIAISHVPLLAQVSSASQLPQSNGRPKHTAPNVDLSTAIEYHKNTANHLRKIHDNDRKAWEIEKASLLARIADLEFKLNVARDPNRRASNESSYDSGRSFRSDIASSFTSASNGPSRKLSDHAPGAPLPVWHGPEYTPPVTRVFSHDDDVDHLPSISEDGPSPALSRQVSPTYREEARAISIDKFDKELDGIIMRTTAPAITSSFVKVASPLPISPERGLSPGTKDAVNGGLKVQMNRLLSPLDEKLTRHAGHTPMIFDGAMSTEATTDTVPTPRIEQPLEPVPTTRTTRQPSEKSDSYFSFSEKVASKPDVGSETVPENAIEDANLDNDEDPPLRGPLMLDSSAKSLSANDFLDQVDAKLKEAASHHRADSSVSENGNTAADNGSSERKNKKDDEAFPNLRIRKSTNFGSAWGEAPAKS